MAHAALSSVHPTRGRSTTAATLSTAHSRARAEVKLSRLPKKSPFPSTAIECHHSLKLLLTLAAEASWWVGTPGSGATLRADMRTAVPAQARAATASMASAATTG